MRVFLVLGTFICSGFFLEASRAEKNSPGEESSGGSQPTYCEEVLGETGGPQAEFVVTSAVPDELSPSVEAEIARARQVIERYLALLPRSAGQQPSMLRAGLVLTTEAAMARLGEQLAGGAAEKPEPPKPGSTDGEDFRPSETIGAFWARENWEGEGAATPVETVLIPALSRNLFLAFFADMYPGKNPRDFVARIEADLARMQGHSSGLGPYLEHLAGWVVRAFNWTEHHHRQKLLTQVADVIVSDEDIETVSQRVRALMEEYASVVRVRPEEPQGETEASDEDAGWVESGVIRRRALNQTLPGAVWVPDGWVYTAAAVAATPQGYPRLVWLEDPDQGFSVGIAEGPTLGRRWERVLQIPQGQRGSENDPTNLAISPSGLYLAYTRGENSAARVMYLEHGEARGRYARGGRVRMVSDDGNWVVLDQRDGDFTVASTDQHVSQRFDIGFYRSLGVGPDWRTRMAFRPGDRPDFYYIEDDRRGKQELKVWKNGESSLVDLRQGPGYRNQWMGGLAVGRDRGAVIDESSNLIAFSLSGEDDPIVVAVPYFQDHRIRSTAMALDGRYYALDHSEGISVWDLEEGDRILDFPKGQDSVLGNGYVIGTMSFVQGEGGTSLNFLWQESGEEDGEEGDAPPIEWLQIAIPGA